MKKSYLKIIFIELLTIILLSYNILKFKFNNYYYLIIYFIIIFGLLYLLLGFEKDKYRFKKDIILNLLIYSISYLLLTYIMGVFTGFVRNGSWLSIIHDLLPYFSLIIVSELVRYEIVKKGEPNLIIYSLVVIIFTLVDVTLYINTYDLATSDGLIKLICCVLMPSISKNIMLTYLTKKVGYKPSIIYRFIFELKSFLLPIFPDFGTYLNAILDLLYPVFITFRVKYLFSTFKDKEIVARGRKNKQNSLIFAVIAFIIFLPIVSLTSGLFKYYAVTIGSGSMTPHINKGDIVLVEKLTDEEKKTLKVGDVLVFHSNNKVICHRIVRIIKFDDDIYFYTKGDFNKSEDGYPTTSNLVIGKGINRLRYIGYPAVYLYELLNKE
jgi:signal peptidase I